MSIRVEERLSKYLVRYINTWLVFAMDVFFSLLATALSLLLSFLFIERLKFGWTFTGSMVICSLIASVCVFLFLGTSKIVIRHSSFKDVMIFAAACVLKPVVVCGVMALLSTITSAIPFNKMYFIIMLMDICLSFFFIITVRVLLIVVYDIFVGKLRETSKGKRILVYGTSDKSVAMVSRFQNSQGHKIIGFITDDTASRNHQISKYPIHYFSGDGKTKLRELYDRFGVYGILFATDSDMQKEASRLIESANVVGIKTLFAPHIDEIRDGRKTQFSVREVSIEDLLGRDEIRISMDEIIDNFSGKTVLVTGAAGSIGSELCRQIARFGVAQIIFFDNAETPMHNLRLEFDERFKAVKYVPIIGDVRHLERLDYAFRKFHPQIVFHAAAYKHVPLMEENPCEAVLVNLIGTRYVADKCIEYGVEKMIMVSTDKAVNPTNVMGCTKRLAEIYVQSLGQAEKNGAVKGSTKFVTTRFGNVLGSNGSVIPRFREQIAMGGPVTVTHPDINRFFMTIPEACRLVMEAATLPVENRICVFDMGEPVKIDDLARKMIQLSGYTPNVDIDIVYTGLRPGEKLYEELLSSVENTEPTSHERIRIAHVRKYEYAEAVKFSDELAGLSIAVDIPSTVKLMKEIVPEYISNNSKFSEYDKK